MKKMLFLLAVVAATGCLVSSLPSTPESSPHAFPSEDPSIWKKGNFEILDGGVEKNGAYNKVDADRNLQLQNYLKNHKGYGE